MDACGDERVVISVGAKALSKKRSVYVYIYIYIALFTFAGAFCERSCVVLLHLLLLFELTPFAFFHYDALHAQCSIAATRTIRLSRELRRLMPFTGYHV